MDITVGGHASEGDPSHGATRPTTVALPWTTSPSRGEDRVTDPMEGKDTTEGNRGGVCGLATKGRCPVDLG
jgi:hypothetical protein